MNILIVDALDAQDEFALKFKGDYATTFINNEDLSEEILKDYDVIFDFGIDNYPENILLYGDKSDKFVFLNAVKIQLSDLIYSFGEVDCKLFGFNGLPTFVSGQYLEVSLYNEDHKSALDYISKELNTEYLLVEDRVGLVTPRVVCMIINEACYTLQEGTAGMDDIDMGMKFGTNYPYGPFEWADLIGVDNVFETLEAIYEDTKDERYKICPLLKTKYLRAERFRY